MTATRSLLERRPAPRQEAAGTSRRPKRSAEASVEVSIHLLDRIAVDSSSGDRAGAPLDAAHGVQVLSGPLVADSLDALGARAASRGANIFLRERSAPVEVVAHEVTHALQSRRGGTATAEVVEQHAPQEVEAVQALRAPVRPAEGLAPGAIALLRQSLRPAEDPAIAVEPAPTGEALALDDVQLTRGGPSAAHAARPGADAPTSGKVIASPHVLPDLGGRDRGRDSRQRPAAVTVAARHADGSRDRAAEATRDRTPEPARGPEPEPEPAPALVMGPRASHDPPALPVGASCPTSLWRGAIVQTKLMVSTPGHPLEAEADAVAARVVRGNDPRPPAAPNLSARGRLLRAATPARGPPQSTGSAGRGSRTVGSILAQQGGGRPLDRGVRERIEPHLGMDLSSVRVRDGPDAAAVAHALHARAFTSGSTIFLAAGSSSADLALMAHEATHVAQQASLPATRMTLMRDFADVLPDLSLPDVSVADLIPAWILDGVRSALQLTPGYALLTYITGTDPLTGAPVPVSPESFVDQLLSFGPFGAGVGAVLGAIDAVVGVYDLLVAELVAYSITPARIQADIDSAWAQFSITLGIEGNLAIVRGYVERILADIAAFVATIAERVVALVRAAAVTAAETVLDTPPIEPVWSLAKKVLHYDPLRGLPVEAATVEILADFLRLIGEEERLAQMEERGTLQQTADWLDTQFETFAGLATELAALYAGAWAAIQPENLPNLLANLEALAASTVDYVQGVAAFAFTVIAKVLELVKQALLGLLSEHAHMVPGFHLLTVIIGHNPFTGEPVPLTAENLIRGFITLLPGGEATYDELVQSVVIPDAAARIEGAIASLGLSLELVTSTFLGIWNSLTLDDLLDPLAAIVRVLAAFGEPLMRLLQLVPVVVQVVIELVLALMNFPSELLARVIANVAAAIGDITGDPIGFLKNMVEALKAGFVAFVSNIVVHLTQGLVDWLFRGLGKLGITLPTDLSFASILDLVFQVLGLTEETLWEKLAEHTDVETVGMIRDGLEMLSGAWAFLVDVQERGLAAIWELIAGQLSSLWQTLLGVAMEWVMTQIITSGTIKLLSFLDPTFIMSVINGCIAFFNAIQAAVEYFRDMLEILDLYVGTLAQVAAGNIAPGAQMIEQGLAAVVPMAIGLLAYLLGIDDIPYRIAQIIEGVRDAIDRAIDWLIEQAIRLGSAALAALGGLTGADGAPAATPEAAEPAVGREIDVDQGFTLDGEAHTLRVQIDPSGDASVVMASDGFGTFRDRLKNLETRYAPLVAATTALATLLRSDVAAMIGESENLEAAAESLRPRGQLMPTAEVARMQGEYESALRGGLKQLGGRLAALGEKFAFGPGAAVAVDETILLFGSSMTRVGVVSKVGATFRSGDDFHFGFSVRVVGSDAPIPRFYEDHGRTWTQTTVPAIVDAGTVSLFFGPHNGNWRVMNNVGEPLNTAPTRASFTPLGFGTTAPTSKLLYDQRGHLIANQFFGPGNVALNIEAMHGKANGIDMPAVQRMIVADIRKTHGIYRIEVQPLPVGQHPPDFIEVRWTQVFPPPIGPSTTATVPNL